MTDREQLLHLYRQCFPEDDISFWDWFFAQVYRPENTLVLREQGKIVASLQMLPCKMKLKDRLFEAHYIYAAATLPAWQGKGLMARLLAQAAEEGLRRGQAFSVLITQEDSLMDYYARFGYQNRFMISDLPPLERLEEGTLRQRVAVPADIPALCSIYDRETCDYLCGQRDEAFWEQQLELFGTGARVAERNGQITAYAFADERGVLEAAGADAAQLAGAIAPGRVWRTFPKDHAHPMGCIRVLSEEFRAIMEQNPCFLNLMFN